MSSQHSQDNQPNHEPGTPQSDQFAQAQINLQLSQDGYGKLLHRLRLEEKQKPGRYIRRKKGTKAGRFEAKSFDGEAD